MRNVKKHEILYKSPTGQWEKINVEIAKRILNNVECCRHLSVVEYKEIFGIYLQVNEDEQTSMFIPLSRLRAFNTLIDFKKVILE